MYVSYFVSLSNIFSLFYNLIMNHLINEQCLQIIEFYDRNVCSVKKLNGERYCEMISNFFLSKIQSLTYVTWQQDGATCRTARVTLDLLRGEFGEHFISRSGLVNWSPRSCDLTPLGYFLWGYIKAYVFTDKSSSIDGIGRQHWRTYSWDTGRNVGKSMPKLD